MTEKCPLCDRPRPGNAKRCTCNYVFEYDQPAGRRSVSSPGLAPVIGAVAIAAAVVAAWWFESSVGPAQNPRPALGLFLFPAGAFAVVGAIFDWSWFFRARKARFIVAVLGRTGARITYGVLGGALAGMGVGMLLVGNPP